MSEAGDGQKNGGRAGRQRRRTLRRRGSRPALREVIVLERDRLPPEAEHRRGVPQSKHPHFLLNSGRRAIGEIFPGFEDALIAAGGMLLMPSMDAAYCENDGWAPRKSGSMTMVYSSRVLIERVLRDKVRELPGIELREGVTVTGLRSAGGGTAGGRVTGVEYRTADGEDATLAADLVVDALGRGSSVVDWLGRRGLGRAAGEDPRRQGHLHLALVRPAAGRRAAGRPGGGSTWSSRRLRTLAVIPRSTSSSATSSRSRAIAPSSAWGPGASPCRATSTPSRRRRTGCGPRPSARRRGPARRRRRCT